MTPRIRALGSILAALGIGTALYCGTVKTDTSIAQDPLHFETKSLALIDSILACDSTLAMPPGRFRVFFRDVTHDELVTDYEDSVKVDLYHYYLVYRAEPSGAVLDTLAQQLESNLQMVQGSPILSDFLVLFRMAQHINKTYDEERQALFAYLDKTWPSIAAALTGKEYEQGGYIAKEGNSFRVQYIDDGKQSLLPLVSAALEGVVHVEPATFQDIWHEGINLETLLKINDHASELRELSLAHHANALSESTLMVCRNIETMTQGILQSYGFHSYDPKPYLPAILRNKDVVTHWHSHTSRSYSDEGGASHPDKSISQFIGNGLIFQLTDIGLCVYEYRFDTSRLVRFYPRTEL